MASHLGRTVQEAQSTITSTELFKWSWYLDWRDTEEFHREDFYLAQIAAEVIRGQVKHPKRVKLKNFILKFNQDLNKSDKEERTRLSKKHWLGITGVIKGKGRLKKRKLPKRKKKE